MVELFDPFTEILRINVLSLFCWFSAGSLALKNLRTVLFQQAVNTTLSDSQRGIKITSKATDLLEASSCFGSHEASLMLAALHLSGLAGVVDQQQVQPPLIGPSNCCFFTRSATSAVMVTVMNHDY